MLKKILWILVVLFLMALSFSAGAYLALKGAKRLNTGGRIQVVPEAEAPDDRFTTVTPKHIVMTADHGSFMIICHSGKGGSAPEKDFTVFLSPETAPVWEITWKCVSYYDFDGDLLFDLRFAGPATPAMFRLGEEWKACRIVKLKQPEVLYEKVPYVFRGGKWEKKALVPLPEGAEK